MTKAELEQIDKLVEKLDISIAEAKDIIASDKLIDGGGRTDFDLSKEEEKQAKKWANVGTRKAPTIYKFDQKQKKANPTKEGIIVILAEALGSCGLDIQNLEIPNKGKLITFDFAGNKFEVDLKQKRVKK